MGGWDLWTNDVMEILSRHITFGEKNATSSMKENTYKYRKVTNV